MGLGNRIGSRGSDFIDLRLQLSDSEALQLASKVLSLTKRHKNHFWQVLQLVVRERLKRRIELFDLDCHVTLNNAERSHRDEVTQIVVAEYQEVDSGGKIRGVPRDRIHRMTRLKQERHLRVHLPQSGDHLFLSVFSSMPSIKLRPQIL